MQRQLTASGVPRQMSARVCLLLLLLLIRITFLTVKDDECPPLFTSNRAEVREGQEGKKHDKAYAFFEFYFPCQTTRNSKTKVLFIQQSPPQRKNGNNKAELTQDGFPS